MCVCARRDPVKVVSKKRIVIGLREANRELKANRLKCLIVSPIVDAGVVDDKLTQLVANARLRNVPVVFALSRRRMARCIEKPKSKVTLVGLLSTENLQGLPAKLSALADTLRQQWKDRHAATAAAAAHGGAGGDSSSNVVGVGTVPATDAAAAGSDTPV